MVRRLLAPALLAPALLAVAAPVRAQAGSPEPVEEDRAPVLQVAGFGGISLREFDGLRFGKDLVTGGLRLIRPREGLSPWLEAAVFSRPDFECTESLACNKDGWMIRAGVRLPLSVDPLQRGLHPAILAAIGASFSEDTDLSYLVGVGASWRQIPRLAPFAELRWEQVAGLNVVLFNLGLRLDL